MSRWHSARRRDANHKGIVKCLRRYGATVIDLAAAGQGVPDLLVGYAGRTIMLEVKNPATKRGQQGMSGKRTAARQQKFRDEWRGAPVYVVYTASEALAKLAEPKPWPFPTLDVESTRNVVVPGPISDEEWEAF